MPIRNLEFVSSFLAPRAGIGPATVSLTASRSTAELPGNIYCITVGTIGK